MGDVVFEVIDWYDNVKYEIVELEGEESPENAVFEVYRVDLSTGKRKCIGGLIDTFEEAFEIIRKYVFYEEE
jgi:hypothetical protein